MVLEMDQRARERLAGAITQLARKTRRDGRPHDLTMVFGDDFAASVVSVAEEMHRELPDRVEALGVSRAERSGLGRWLGLGVVAAGKGRLAAMGVLVSSERVERPLVVESEATEADADRMAEDDGT